MLNQLCTVSAGDGHLHATQYLTANYHCDGINNSSVFDQMMTFLQTHG